VDQREWEEMNEDALKVLDEICHVVKTEHTVPVRLGTKIVSEVDTTV